MICPSPCGRQATADRVFLAGELSSPVLLVASEREQREERVSLHRRRGVEAVVGFHLDAWQVGAPRALSYPRADSS